MVKDMSLRQYYAGIFMQAMLSSSDYDLRMEDYARVSCEYADTLIRQLSTKRSKN